MDSDITKVGFVLLCGSQSSNTGRVIGVILSDRTTVGAKMGFCYNHEIVVVLKTVVDSDIQYKICRDHTPREKQPQSHLLSASTTSF